MKEHIQSLFRKAPQKTEVVKALNTFSPLERLLFIILLAIAGISMITVVTTLNRRFLVDIPTTGGTLVEGIVGTPRFINPVLATTGADRDITTLVYRGLMRRDETGAIIPDLASSYEISEDGKQYTFTLQEGVAFHDGVPITTNDIAFTITAVRDPLLKSLHRVEWEGVGLQVIDEKTITFNLANPYSPFLQSTTIGILPKHVWENVSYENWAYSDLNTNKAVGNGYYRITKVTKNSSGIPEEYTLKRVSDEVLIDTIRMKFYANEHDLVSAFKKGDIQSMSGISPENMTDLPSSTRVLATPLPRVFGLFFNQNENTILGEKVVRTAIDTAINKERVVEEILKGYGHVAVSPILQSTRVKSTVPTEERNRPAEVAELLARNGWEQGEDGIYAKKDVRLSFEIATNNVPELRSTAELIVEDLRQSGIEAILKVYETGSLNQDIIRPRRFEALFFGESVTSQSDLFAFWHSSQRTDPGLNITGYANARVDRALERLLATVSGNESLLYSEVERELIADMPAVFVYSPSFIYVVRESMPGITLGSISQPEHRFSTIPTWYLETESVWKLFTK